MARSPDQLQLQWFRHLRGLLRSFRERVVASALPVPLSPRLRQKFIDSIDEILELLEVVIEEMTGPPM